jgi:acyl-CoA thioesterase-1
LISSICKVSRWFIYYVVTLLLFAAPAAPPQVADGELQNIVFFGNSLTAGYGIGPDKAFPALIQAKIDSLQWPFKVINAGLSGETTSGGLRRIDWIMNRQIDVLVLELGGNDALRGISVAVTRANLQGIIDKLMKKYPEADVVIAGMQAPPNLGETYITEFNAIFSQLARKNQAALIPFLLQGVAGIPELNLRDRIHPTAEGHRTLANNVWSVLKPLLRQRL